VGAYIHKYTERDVHTGFWWGDLREGDHLEDTGVDGRTKLKWSFEKGQGCMEWIDLADDRDTK
jgi:hypothetical protein